MFKSILIFSLLTVFAFTQTAGKMGLLSKAYKLIYNISIDDSETAELEQDDCNEDGDCDAIPISLNCHCSLSSGPNRFNSQEAFRSNHYSIPDSPPPDFT